MHKTKNNGKSNALVKEKFEKCLISLLKSDLNSSIDKDNKKCSHFANNIWLFNDIIIPFGAGEKNGKHCNYLKLKYSTPENGLSTYSSLNKNLLNSIHEKFAKLDEVTTKSTEIQDELKNFSMDINPEFLINTNLKQTQTISKNHIHTFYACNKQGLTSPPLFFFPRNEIEANIHNHNLNRTVCIEESSNGELNELNGFIKWLHLFVKKQDLELLRQQHINGTGSQKNNRGPFILLLNSFLHYFLFQNIKPASEPLLAELIAYCKNEKIFILFYPMEKRIDAFNRSLFAKFNDTWKSTLAIVAAKENPHTQVAFVTIYKQVIHKLFNTQFNKNQPNFTHSLMRECFNELFQLYSIPDELLEKTFGNSLKQVDELNLDEVNSKAKNNELDEIDDEDGNQTNGLLTANTVNNINKNNIHTSQEVDELVEWIDKLSDIGSLCIKYTFLKEFYIKQRQILPAATNTNKSKETLASEKRWIDFTEKNRQKFKCKFSCGLNENDYLLRWFDTDFWRMSYYNYVKQECKINSPDSLWTCDVIQFPFSLSNSVLKAPEKDYQTRPRFQKPRVSVIFAFSASGDYIPPFFVYPDTFKQTELENDQKNETTTNAEYNNSSECFSSNGYVTCRVFETWLSKLFLPYLKQKQNNQNNLDPSLKVQNESLSSTSLTSSNDKKSKCNSLLLYCGKLSIIDTTNLKLCHSQENRLNLFALTTEQQMPFNILFQKNLRKRQTDLFLDSWRKITAKLNLSHQFKCKTRSQFFNLFMDAFQNCIEEIGNKSDMDESVGTTVEPNENSSSVLDFKNKMIKSFEQCQLWPLNYEEYAQYFENAKKKLEELEANKEEENNDVKSGEDIGNSESESEPLEEDEQENDEVENQPKLDTDDEEFQPRKRARFSNGLNSNGRLKKSSVQATIPIQSTDTLIDVDATPAITETPSNNINEITNDNVVEMLNNNCDIKIESTLTSLNIEETKANSKTPLKNTISKTRPDTPQVKQNTSYDLIKTNISFDKRISDIIPSDSILFTNQTLNENHKDKTNNIIEDSINKTTENDVNIDKMVIVEEITTEKNKTPENLGSNEKNFQDKKDLLIEDLLTLIIKEKALNKSLSAKSCETTSSYSNDPNTSEELIELSTENNLDLNILQEILGDLKNLNTRQTRLNKLNQILFDKFYSK